jgi:hypothetical protein
MNIPGLSVATSSSPQVNRWPTRRNVVLGTGNSSVGSRFKGVPPRVPKVFISRCELSTVPEDISDHFKQEGIKSVVSVEMATSQRPQLRPPRTKSFIVSFSKFDDFQKVMTGAYLPGGVEVKKYFPPRERTGSDEVGSFRKKYQELEDLASLGLRNSATSPVCDELSLQKQASVSDVSHTIENMIPSDTTASAQDQEAEADSRTNTD